MENASVVWILTFAMFGIILTWEVRSALGSNHAPTIKSSAIWSVIYIVAALLFALPIIGLYDRTHAMDYITGYVTERALSIDNLFVFILIMAAFQVPKQFQQIVMLVGVGVAIILRALFILVGAAVIQRFSWVFWIFGIFLLLTAFKLVSSSNQESEDEYSENAFIAFVRRVVPVSSDYEGRKVFTRVDGRRAITPLAIVMLAIGSTDLMFAFDSIPAIFGITQEPYLVFLANAWALMGMVQLYFLLGGLLQRLIYLSYGLAFILGMIGIKLMIHALHENNLPFINGGMSVDAIPEISTPLSLVLIVLAISVSAVFSLRKTSGDDTQLA